MDAFRWFTRLLQPIVILVVATGVSFAGTRDPSTSDAKYLAFGKEFPMVVQLRNAPPPDPKAKPGSKCIQTASAVLISDHWALTAAHVVHNAKDNVILIDKKEFPLPYVIWHKDYDPEKVGFHDIAICYSPEPFGLKFYPALYRKADEVGKTITISGFGTNGTFLTGATAMDDLRRAGHNKIDGELHAVLTCSPSRAGRFPLEFGISPGDSGGGMFIGNELAGINSFVMSADSSPNGSYGDDSAFTRVSLYADWVDDQIEQHKMAIQGRATTGPSINDIPVLK